MTNSSKTIGALVATMIVASPLPAQLANPSAAALGMGENFTAVARGYAAVAWNPAALGLQGNPHTSAMIGTFRILGGLRPVTLSDVTPFQDAVVPEAVKAQWLAEIIRAGGQRGAAGFDMTWATVQTGRFGLQVSSSARAANEISPGFAELMLFGNVADNGNPKTLDLDNSAIDVHLYSSIALSFGLPVTLHAGPGRIAFGVTAKHTIGHVLAVSEESSGRATAEPLSLEFSFPIAYSPLVRDDDSYQLKSGSGFGVDVALGYETATLTIAAVAQNVLNTFEWDAELLRFRAAELIFSDDVRETTFSAQPLTAAPAALRARVAEQVFEPSFGVGAMLRYSPKLTLAADARFGGADGMATRPPVHAGAGAEYRPLHWLPLQLGAAYVKVDSSHAGHQITGGVGAQLGSFMVAVSGGRRDVGRGVERMLMLTLLSHTF